MNYLKHLFLYTAAGLLAACNTLDYTPEDWYGSSTFWENQSQVEGFMVGIHKKLRDANEYIYLLGEARGGTQKSGSSSLGTSLNYSSPIKDNTFTNNNTGVTNWAEMYTKILNVNQFIDKVENECDFLGAADRSFYLGQAYGIRAYFYFHLYRTYGGVPIVTEAKVMNGVTGAESLYLARNSAKETLDFIKEDIRKSEEGFGNNASIKSNKAMWSKAATEMLKGEVYLWSAKVTTANQQPSASDLSTAKTALSQLLNAGFVLLPEFEEVFAYDNKGNDEIIFALRFADGEKENWAYDFTYRDANFIGIFYGTDGRKIETDTLVMQNGGMLRHEWKQGFFDAYDDLDTRKRATFLDFYEEDGTYAGSCLRKCLGTINKNGNRSFSDDYVIYRYADVLLMMAEITNMENGDVAAYLNPVRERAYGKNYDPDIHGYKNGSFEENELAILHERDKEFVWEGKRWYDIRRMHDVSGQPLVFSPKANYDDPNPVIKTAESYKLLWPIDINTLNNDPLLENNPDY